jgi:hypothetical protein
VLDGGGVEVFLVAAGDLAGVAVGVEVLEVGGDGGVVCRDGGVEGGVGFCDVEGEGLGDGAEAVVMLVFLIYVEGGFGFLRYFGCGLVFATGSLEEMYRWRVKMLGVMLALIFS